MRMLRLLIGLVLLTGPLSMIRPLPVAAQEVNTDADGVACAFAGTTTFSPPIQAIGGNSVMTMTGSGTCAGALDDSGNETFLASGALSSLSCTFSTGSGTIEVTGGEGFRSGPMTMVLTGTQLTLIATLFGVDTEPEQLVGTLAIVPSSVPCASPWAGGTTAGSIIHYDLASDSNTCLVSGGQNFTNGSVTNTPATLNNNGSITLQCPLQAGDDGGTWNFSFTGSGTEACIGGAGSETITGGSTTSDGSVTGGSLTYVRTADVMQIVGTINTSPPAETHSFSATVAWLPSGNPPLCPAPNNASLLGEGSVADT